MCRKWNVTNRKIFRHLGIFYCDYWGFTVIYDKKLIRNLEKYHMYRGFQTDMEAEMAAEQD